MRGTVYSYSRLSALDKCELQYALRYCERNHPRWESIESFVGQRVHEVAEAVQKNKCKPTPAEIWALLSERWDTKWHEKVFDTRGYGTDHWRDHATRCASNFLRVGMLTGNSRLIGIEARLGKMLLLDPPRTFIGILDRIACVDSPGPGYASLQIHDFKTGKKQSRRYFEQDHQLPLYARLVEHEHGIDPNLTIRCARVYLATAEIEILDVTPARRDAAWQWAIRNAHRAIELEAAYERTGEAEPTRGPLCEWCAYKRDDACVAWAVDGV